MSLIIILQVNQEVKHDASIHFEITQKDIIRVRVIFVAYRRNWEGESWYTLEGCSMVQSPGDRHFKHCFQHRGQRPQSTQRR